MLSVAERVFADRGYVAASMDDIAEQVGVSKPMLYEYFGSKEGLLIGTVRAARAELRTVTEAAVAGSESIEEALRNGLVAFFDFITEHRQSWSLLRNESALMSGSAGSEIEQTRRQQTDLMIAVMRTLSPDVEEIRIEAAAEIIVGACERLANWCERKGDVTSAQAADYVMQLTWYGLRDLRTAG